MPEPTFQKLDVLAIDSESANRMRVKAATSAVGTFGKFHQAQSLGDALRRFSGSETVDIVFISHEFKDEMIEFVKQAKQTQTGQDVAYVLMVKANEDLGTQIATNMLAGIDGFLQEPYSVDAINEIAQLTVRVKKERAASREAMAMRLLMQQVSDKISSIAQLKAAGLDGKRELRKLAEMCATFSALDEDKRAKYLEVAADVFEKAPIPSKLPVKAYGGVSDRVKRKMEEKIMNKIAGEK